MRRKRKQAEEPKLRTVTEMELDVGIVDASTTVPQSLADQLVERAERSREAVLDRASREWQTAQAIVYVGDAVLALTERLTELER